MGRTELRIGGARSVFPRIYKLLFERCLILKTDIIGYQQLNPRMLKVIFGEEIYMNFTRRIKLNEKSDTAVQQAMGLMQIRSFISYLKDHFYEKEKEKQKKTDERILIGTRNVSV